MKTISAIFPAVTSGFLFTFASKCIPTFFSVFLLSNGYSNRDIILISSVFFMGSLCVSQNSFTRSMSLNLFHICATIASIILLLQAYVDKVWIWFLIRFIQGYLETVCRNSLFNIVSARHAQTLVFFMNFGSTAGFLLMCYKNAFAFLFTITGILLNLSHMCLSFQVDASSKSISSPTSKYKNWRDILSKNPIIFFTLILSCLLTSTFSTILPITLRYNGFQTTNILHIMFVGSLGNTILQTISHYLKNIMGGKVYMRVILYSLLFFYLLCISTMHYISLITSLCVFFIIGFHHSLNSTILLFVTEVTNGVAETELRGAVSQINNIGAIVASIIALMFIDTFPQYGIFILWFAILILIQLFVRILETTGR